MLAVARSKAAASASGARFTFALGSAADAAAVAGGPFDTVVDTFGLCSYADPAAALQAMAAALAPGGVLLLLEHGRSHYAAVNGVLDRGAHAHAAQWGCEWNRDIDAVVAAAGLEITARYRLHFGTTYYFKCRKRS